LINLLLVCKIYSQMTHVPDELYRADLKPLEVLMGIHTQCLTEENLMEKIL
jgi:hypothetical protein